MGFLRQEYWSGFPCPPPGYLPDPGIESSSLMSPALADGFFTTSATWEAHDVLCIKVKYAGWQCTALSYSFPNFEPGHCSMSGSDYCFLTHIQVFRRQVRRSGTPISLRIFQFVVIHTIKGFSVVKKAEVDVFQELPCFYHDPMNVANSISGSSASLKPSLRIWKFSVHVLLDYLEGFWESPC